MCLDVQAGEFIRIAEAPISVYKVLQKRWRGGTAPYMPFQYRRGKTYSISRLYLTLRDGIYRVHRGFHAYRNQDYAAVMCNLLNQNNEGKFKIVKMVIPVGAEYVLGDSAEIVSNKIRWQWW